MVEFKKVHEDKRGAIYSLTGLLENDKEFAFLEVRKNCARGGCFHSKDECLSVIKGRIKLIKLTKKGHEIAENIDSIRRQLI